MEAKPFTKYEWEGFAGAEQFSVVVDYNSNGGLTDRTILSLCCVKFGHPFGHSVVTLETASLRIFYNHGGFDLWRFFSSRPFCAS
jgi:hypothetical protein